jgi:hypothetical protein
MLDARFGGTTACRLVAGDRADPFQITIPKTVAWRYKYA